MTRFFTFWLSAPAFILQALALAGCAEKSADLAASPPDCAQLEQKEGDFLLGCANRLNLATMVADPKDLKTGRVLGLADGERESLAVDAYRKDKVKDLKTNEPMTSFSPDAGGGAK